MQTLMGIACQFDGILGLRDPSGALREIGVVMGGSTRSILAPFGVRNFRFQWPSDLLASLAFEMELILLGWYVLVETGSVMWLTAFGALHFYGTIFSPLFGVAGDRMGHRNLLCLMRGWYLAIALTLMGLAFAGLLSPLVVLALAALMGLARPSDLAVRAATAASIVPPALLVGAMGTSRSTSDIARIVGALTGAGVVAGLGMGPAYAVVSACYALSFLLELCVRPTPRAISPAASAIPPINSPMGELPRRASPWRDLKDGLAYVWTSPRLLAAMWLAFLLNATTLPLSGNLLAYVAKNVYQTDQRGLGLLSACFATGAFIGSMVLSASGDRLRFARIMMAATFAWCCVLLVFAQTTTMASGMALMAVAGFLQSLSMVTMAMMLLATSEERLRGRVMGVRMLAIVSQVPGLLLAGALIERFGFALTATGLAGGALLLTAAIFLRWREELWPMSAAANARPAG